MTDLPGDPNWLLATVTQSTVIMVAFLSLRLRTAPASWFGLLVIAYLTVAGIMLPLALMPARSGAFDLGAEWSLWGLQLSGLHWKRLILGTFASGVLAVLAQVAWELKAGTARPEPRDEEPNESG